MNSYHILYLFNLPRSEQCRKEIRESREKKNTKETLVRIKTIKGWKHTNKQWNLLFEKSEPTFPKKDLTHLRIKLKSKSEIPYKSTDMERESF